jgi:hypothetical protein
MKKLRTFYGFTKLTPKIVRKPELAIWFENSNHNKAQNDKFIAKRIDVVHTRYQTRKECSDAVLSNRIFTKYGYLINEKPYFGQIDLVLERNFMDDSNNVKLDERRIIRDLLRIRYFEFYEVSRKSIGQQVLIFNK